MAVIYAIPGLGCNKWLFQNLRVEGHTIKVLEWPKPIKNFTLKGYAKEFIQQIDQSQEFYLTGVSFGGMLCVEIAELTAPKKTIIISSCKNRKELPVIFRILKYIPVHLLFPDKFEKKVALMSWKLLGFSRTLLPEFNLMIRSMPPNHFRYSINYIVSWNRKNNSKPLIHIHGSGDKLLRLFYIKKADYIVPNGTHAMVFTRADEVSKILEEVLK